MTLKIITGNLVEEFKNNKFDYIAHACNYTCILDDVDSLKIIDAYPAVEDRDLETVDQSFAKSGTYSFLATECGIILNLYIYDRRRNKNYLNFAAAEHVFSMLNKDLPPGSKVAIPLLGNNSASPDWGLVSRIIEAEALDLDITVIKTSD